MGEFVPEVPILYGDGKHDDRAVLRHLFLGGVAYCMRSEQMVLIPTLEELPPGHYRVQPEHPD